MDVAKVKPENFAAFNISDNRPMDNKEQEIRTTGVQITFLTNNASLGFALDMGSYLLVYALNDSQFKFEMVHSEILFRDGMTVTVHLLKKEPLLWKSRLLMPKEVYFIK